MFLPMRRLCVDDKMAHQHRDIAGAIAQRRSEDRENFEPIIEVAAKLFLGNHLAPGRDWWRQSGAC